MPLRNWYNCGTKHFHQTSVVWLKWKTQLDWVIKPVPDYLVRRIRFWTCLWYLSGSPCRVGTSEMYHDWIYEHDMYQHDIYQHDMYEDEISMSSEHLKQARHLILIPCPTTDSKNPIVDYHNGKCVLVQPMRGLKVTRAVKAGVGFFSLCTGLFFHDYKSFFSCHGLHFDRSWRWVAEEERGLDCQSIFSNSLIHFFSYVCISFYKSLCILRKFLFLLHESRFSFLRSHFEGLFSLLIGLDLTGLRGVLPKGRKWWGTIQCHQAHFFVSLLFSWVYFSCHRSVFSFHRLHLGKSQRCAADGERGLEYKCESWSSFTSISSALIEMASGSSNCWWYMYNACMCVHEYLCIIFMYMYMYMYLYVCIYIFTRMYIYIYIIHVETYKYTYICI